MDNNNMDYVDISSASSDKREPARVSSNSSKQKKPNKNNLLIRIICSVLSVIFLIGGIGCLYGYSSINSVRYEDLPETTKPTSDGTDTTEAGLTFERDPSTLLNDPYVLNIMLYGADQFGQGGLSDSMILLSIDNRHQKIKLTSFLRDTYISIPGYYAHKLNLAYSLGGPALSISTIESNYGIQIDRYAVVNFTSFKKIVDIMGGVTVELSGDEIDYINAQIQYNNQTEYLYAEPGMVTLNGQQALWYARDRGGTYSGMSFSGDDWDRTDRQRKFLHAVMDQMKSASITELIEIVNNIGPMVTTNLKKSEITSLLSGATTYLGYSFEECSMPSSGSWSYGWNNAGSVILVDDWNGARHDLAKFIYEELVVD